MIPSEVDNEDFKRRYSRQIAIPEIGLEGQKKISRSKVLIIGAGALGSMVAMQLAAAGVGVLGIADFDNVEISNLQRQFFFSTQEAGTPKVDIVAKRISAINPSVKVNSYRQLMGENEARNIFPTYDFIVDATDNPDSKRMIDRVAKESYLPCCIAGVRDFSGQVITIMPDNIRFHDIFGDSDPEGFLPCSLGGVGGPAAALCASVQAGEVIKYMTDAGALLNGKLFTFNLLTNSYSVFML